MVDSYHVGQIIYIIPTDSPKPTIVPVQIMERRISETATGTAIKHIVKTPKAQSNPIILETIKGMVFIDLKQVQSVMLQRATEAIDSMIKNAVEIAKSTFQSQTQAKAKQDNSDDIFGSAISLEQPEQVSYESYINENEYEQQKSQAMLGLPDTTEIMLPDGTMQQVKVKMKGRK